VSDEEHGEAFKMGESFGFDAGYEAGQAALTRTLRDEFATQYAERHLQGIGEPPGFLKGVAKRAYEFADAMLVAREIKP
jgi:hypothetical protein